MLKHKMDQEMESLEEDLFHMVSLVEDMIDKSVDSLVRKDKKIAQEVINTDEQVNELEVKLDDSCIRLLALYQPQAGELRRITMAMKINNDLERMGDHAVNIAERALWLSSRPQVKPLIDLPRMAKKSIQMVRGSITAFVNSDAEAAIEVCKKDDEVDALEDQIFRELLTYMASNPATIERAIRLIFIARNLERLADLATNVSEDVVFIIQGESIKHHKGDKKQCEESY